MRASTCAAYTRILTAALVAALTLRPTGSVAQDTGNSVSDSAAASFRDPHLARRLALAPGLGYVYTGEYLRGLRTLLATIAGLGLGPVIYRLDNCSIVFYSPCTPTATAYFRIVGIGLVVSGASVWVKSFLDAPRSAERANQRHLYPLIAPPETLEAWRLGLTYK